MKRMAQTFNTNVNDLEKELATLIADKQIKARIDSHNKVILFVITLILSLGVVCTCDRST